MWEDCAAHEDGDLLDNFDACVSCLPRLLALAHRLEEGQQCWDAEGAGHDRERASCGVTHILIDVVNVRPHGCDHSGQSCCLQS